MKLVLINYEYPPLGGGAGRATQAFAEGLSRRGHDVTVVTGCLPGESKKILQGVPGPTDTRWGSLNICRIPVHRKEIYQSSPLELLLFANRAKKLLFKHFNQANKPDAVLSFFTLPSGFAGYRFAQHYSIPHCIFLRGMDVPGFDEEHLQRFHQWLSPMISFLWERADVLLANSQSLKRQAILHSVSHSIPSIQVIENGIDLPQENVHFEPSESGYCNLFSVGRMVPQKGHEFLIRTLSKYRKQLPPRWRLFLIGDGPLRIQLENQVCQEALEDHITFLGWLSTESLHEFYERGHICLHPSVDEGMSNVLLEALSHGCIPIASRVGGNEEVIEPGKNGYLFETQNEEQFATQFIRMIQMFHQHPEQFAQIKAACKESVAHKTWKNRTEELEKVLEDCVYGFYAKPPWSHLISKSPIFEKEVKSTGL